MRFIALADGFINSRIRKGEIFDAPHTLKGKWFERYEPPDEPEEESESDPPDSGEAPDGD